MHSSPPGERMRRLEDPRLVRGRGRYVGDLRLPGCAHVVLVRCPYGHARVTGLALDAARAMPGVIDVFGPDDLPALGAPLPIGMPAPGIEIRMPSPLTRDTVRFAGEAVAAVVAEDRKLAADAADAVEVEYDPLPAVPGIEEALAPDAPLVHQDVPGNVAGRFSRAYGDVDAVAGGIVCRRRFVSERTVSASLEPRAVAAMPGGENGEALTVWDSTQSPYNVRRTLARALDLPEERIRVVTADVGGGFGPKGRLYPEEVIVSALALHLGRALVWEGTRTEDFLATYGGRGIAADATMRVREDGTILAYHVDLVQDCGAYLPAGIGAPSNTTQHLLGPYRIPDFRVDVTCVYTNKSPVSPLRGGGREEGVFITERMLDAVAQTLGLDPAEVRRRNVLAPEEFPYDTRFPSRAGGTVVYDSGDYPAYLERAHDLIGYAGVKAGQAEERAAGIYRGVAVTLFLESTGGATEGARVAVDAEGQVTVVAGSPDNGQGHATVMAQLCAARLGVPVERVRFISGDTGQGVEGIGTFGSRFAQMAGNAVALAARRVRERAIEAAADALEAAPEDLVVEHGAVHVVGVPGRGLELGELVRRDVDLTAAATFQPERASAFAGGAHGAIVRVDAETGRIDVERYVVVHDCGTLINPTIVDGQIQGGVAHGIGNVLGEEMVYGPDGGLLSGSFFTYFLPHATDVPDIEIEHHACPSPFNPEGIKGAGEGGTIGALATLTAAIEDALAPFAIDIAHIPVQPEEIAGLCREKRQAAEKAGQASSSCPPREAHRTSRRPAPTPGGASRRARPAVTVSR